MTVGMQGQDALWAVVPAKGRGQAKSRLSPALDAAAREALAHRMLGHVLTTLAKARDIDGRMVVTDCDHIATLARALGATVVRDPAPGMADTATHPAGPNRPRLAQVVDAGLDRAAALGATHALVMMADLPALAVTDVEAAAGVVLAGQVLLVGDRQGLGTSTLGLELHASPQTRFGHPDSLARHRADLSRRGRDIVELARPGLSLDVDTPADLTDLQDSLGVSIPLPSHAP